MFRSLSTGFENTICRVAIYPLIGFFVEILFDDIKAGYQQSNVYTNQFYIDSRGLLQNQRTLAQ